MPLDRGSIKTGARLKTHFLTDLYDLLNGTITDTDVTFGRNLTVKGALSTVGSVSQVAPGPTNVPITIYGAVGQTANLFEVRNSASDILFAIGAGGTANPIRIGDYTLAQHTHLTPATGGALGAASFGGFEALFGGSWQVTAVNYTVTVDKLYVFCTAGVTVTLPAAATTARPITVIGVTGNSTVVSAGGTVIGGSVNVSTGVVTNGAVSAGESLTYKSDGTTWRAV